MPDIRARNPRTEASARLGGRPVAVLEPSPPAVADGPWFADDPLDPARRDPAIVSPLPTGGATWQDEVAGDADLVAWARAHWLVVGHELPAAPETLAATREALTALAFHVMAPARHQATGKIALRWTKGGFGTPFYGDDRQVRVEGRHLVVQVGEQVEATPITSLAAAAALVGVTPGPPEGIEFHDAPPMPDLDRPFAVDEAAVGFLDQWFGFATALLSRLHHAAGSPIDTRVQLWPEHFDPAIELGDADAGARASFGASLGDTAIDEPYLYVSPWSKQAGDFWNAPFGGAALTLAELRAGGDPIATGLAFFDEGRRLLAASGSAPV